MSAPTGAAVPARLASALSPSEHRAVLLAGDAAATFAAVLISIGLWTITAGVDFGFALEVRAVWFLAVPIWVLGLAASRHAAVALSIASTASAVARLAVSLLVVYLAAYFYAPRDALPRLLALYLLWEVSLLTLAWRLAYVWVVSAKGLKRQALVLGAGPRGQALVEALRAGGVREPEVVGVVDERTLEDAPGSSGASDDSALVAEVLARRASIVVLAVDDISPALTRQLLDCQERGVEVVPMAVLHEQALGRVPVTHVGRDWLFTSYAEAVAMRGSSRIARRVLDLLGGAAGVLLLAVLGPFIGLAIWLDSGRPLFYRQQRLGRGGRPFELLKFRTMVRDAEPGGRAQWADPGDPRATRVGRLLRRTRLDELPNFLNVLSGHMSLVGPRPERPEFVRALEREIPFYFARLIARPGLTGWAQINYPYGNSVEDARVKLEFDLYYLKHRSLLFDLAIVVRTIPTMLSFRGR